MLEKDVEEACGRYLQSRGIYFIKVHQAGYYDARIKRFRRQASPFFVKGVSDFICFMPPHGRALCIEIKSPKGQQTIDQKVFAERVRRQGSTYWVIRSVAELKAALDLYLIVGQH